MKVIKALLVLLSLVLIGCGEDPEGSTEAVQDGKVEKSESKPDSKSKVDAPGKSAGKGKGQSKAKPVDH